MNLISPLYLMDWDFINRQFTFYLLDERDLLFNSQIVKCDCGQGFNQNDSILHIHNQFHLNWEYNVNRFNFYKRYLIKFLNETHEMLSPEIFACNYCGLDFHILGIYRHFNSEEHLSYIYDNDVSSSYISYEDIDESDDTNLVILEEKQKCVICYERQDNFHLCYECHKLSSCQDCYPKLHHICPLCKNDDY